jgi:hypothetical protein
MTAEALGAGSASFAGADPSAPIHFRARALSTGDIVLRETIGGVSVTKRLAGSGFRGVLARKLASTPDASRLSLMRNDGSEFVLEIVANSDVIAAWREASRDFGLPMIVDGGEGRIIALEAMLGAVTRGAVHPGRRIKALTRERRPRFLTRRKTARLPLQPMIYRPTRAARAKWLTDCCTLSATGHEMPAIG